MQIQWCHYNDVTSAITLKSTAIRLFASHFFDIKQKVTCDLSHFRVHLKQKVTCDLSHFRPNWLCYDTDKWPCESLSWNSHPVQSCMFWNLIRHREGLLVYRESACRWGIPVTKRPIRKKAFPGHSVTMLIWNVISKDNLCPLNWSTSSDPRCFPSRLRGVTLRNCTWYILTSVDSGVDAKHRYVGWE